MKKREDNSSEPTCSRREFLRRAGIAGAAAVGAAAVGFGMHYRKPGGQSETVRIPDFGVPPLPTRPRIAAVRGGNIERMLRAAVERLGGIGRFIEPGDVVVLKPNVGFASPPSLAATTHPEVVGAMARLCREAGAESVLVIDNPINNPARCMKISGVAEAAEANGARVIMPKPAAFVDAVQEENAILKQWPFFYAPFENATKVIGLPAAKHHSLAGVTLGMKNWYGLLGGRRNRLHQSIDMSIADLASLMRPTLMVLDATRVLFRNGPTGGSLNDVREEGIIAAATDQVALDTYGASLLGRTPGELPFIVEAERRGLGVTDLKDAGFELTTV